MKDKESLGGYIERLLAAAEEIAQNTGRIAAALEAFQQYQPSSPPDPEEEDYWQDMAEPAPPPAPRLRSKAPQLPFFVNDPKYKPKAPPPSEYLDDEVFYPVEEHYEGPTMRVGGFY